MLDKLQNSENILETLRYSMLQKPVTLTFFFLLLIVFTGSMILQECKPDQSNKQTTATNSFTGEQACQNCHAKAFSDWKQSDHYMAMLPASDSTVKGNFDNSSFIADGVTNHFTKKNEK